MIDLLRRSTEPELMDGPETSAEDHARALADLARVNRITLTHRPVIAWLDDATRGMPGGSALSILDVASGQGDLLRAIHRWGTARGFALTLAGIDLNPRAAASAQDATPEGMPIAYLTGDVFDHVPSPAPDFIVSSQFTHHLEDEDVAKFVRWLDHNARRGWCIVDLHRHAIAFYGFPLLARLMRWHRIVRIDGTISIARSFTRADWQAILARAGVAAGIAWVPLFRWRVAHLK